MFIKLSLGRKTNVQCLGSISLCAFDYMVTRTSFSISSNARLTMRT